MAEPGIAGMRQAVALSPDEQAHSDAYEASPEARAELERAIAQERDPRKRAVLLAYRDGTPSSGPGMIPVSARAPSPFDYITADATPARAPRGAPGAPGASVWDQIDQMASTPPPPAAPPPSSFMRRALGDTGVSLARGVVEVPQALVGMGDIVTGGYLGKAAEAAGVRFKDALDALSDLYSPEQKEANKKVQEAKGFFPTIGAMLQNPSTIGHQALESSLTFIPGGGVARAALWAGLPAAEKAAVLSLPKAEQAAAIAHLAGDARTIAAGAAGEGATAAGQNAEQIREEDPEGLLNPLASAVQAGAGANTGLIAYGVGRVANRLGIGHLPTMLASGQTGPLGAQAVTAGASKGFMRKALEGYGTGFTQETLQSGQEQAAQNIAQGRPVMEGTLEAAAQGGVAGGLLEAPSAVLSGHEPAVDPRLGKVPEVGPMTKALNAGLDAAGARLDAGLTAVPPPKVLSPEATAQAEQLAKDTVKAQAEQQKAADKAAADAFDATFKQHEKAAQEEPAVPALDISPETGAKLLAFANQRATALTEKEKGTKDEKVAGAEGEGTNVRAGTPAQFLTPEEKEELDFLKDHGGDVQRLARAYLEPQHAQALLAAAHQQTTTTETSDAQPTHQPGDVLNPQGEPFKNKTAATRALRALDDPKSHSVVAVGAGYVLRPVAVQAQPATPAVDRGADSGSSVAPAAAGQQAAGAELTTDSTPQATEGQAPLTTGTEVTPAPSQREASPGDALPKELANAKPRYSYGDKQFELTFESDVDKAAYIAAQTTPSKRDADYVAHVSSATGMAEPQVREHGAAVRAAIKSIAKDAEPGVLHVPRVARADVQTKESTHATEQATEQGSVPAEHQDGDRSGQASETGGGDRVQRAEQGEGEQAVKPQAVTSRPADLVELRKRLSVLQSLRECMA